MKLGEGGLGMRLGALGRPGNEVRSSREAWE
jgi:hypothetical protein